MKSGRSLYHRHRFPSEIIRYAVWLYYRFSLSYRDVEDLLAERGVNVSYETIRRRFKSIGQVQRFLAVHAAMRNLFSIPHHLMRAKNYRLFRAGAFDLFEQVTCA
jgi:transposase-like protein